MRSCFSVSYMDQFYYGVLWRGFHGRSFVVGDAMAVLGFNKVRSYCLLRRLRRAGWCVMSRRKEDKRFGYFLVSPNDVFENMVSFPKKDVLDKMLRQSVWRVIHGRG